MKCDHPGPTYVVKNKGHFCTLCHERLSRDISIEFGNEPFEKYKTKEYTEEQHLEMIRRQEEE